jgi:hypothetical protein
MARKFRFVRPEVDRIALSDGDWIEVKRKLTVGERRGILSRAARGGVSTDGKVVHIDGAEMAFGRLEAWLLEWSFVDEKDKPMKLSPEALRNLDPDTFAEIEDAIDAHEKAQAALKNSSASVTDGSSSTPNLHVIASAESSASATDSAGPTTS